jgi:hypothetical protein
MRGMEQAYSYSPSISFFANLSVSYDWMSVYCMVNCKASRTTGSAVKERKFRNTLKWPHHSNQGTLVWAASSARFGSKQACLSLPAYATVWRLLCPRRILYNPHGLYRILRKFINSTTSLKTRELSLLLVTTWACSKFVLTTNVFFYN